MAGDFYDVFLLGGIPGDEALGVVIADVSDKGAPAALFMAGFAKLDSWKRLRSLSPVDTLRRTNELILDDAEAECSSRYSTAFS